MPSYSPLDFKLSFASQTKDNTCLLLEANCPQVALQLQVLRFIAQPLYLYQWEETTLRPCKHNNCWCFSCANSLSRGRTLDTPCSYLSSLVRYNKTVRRAALHVPLLLTSISISPNFTTPYSVRILRISSGWPRLKRAPILYPSRDALESNNSGLVSKSSGSISMFEIVRWVPRDPATCLMLRNEDPISIPGRLSTNYRWGAAKNT